MKKVKVINTGKRVRERLGSRFLPNNEQILEVNSRQYLTLKAVKDFDVEIVDENDLIDNINDEDETVDIDENKVTTEPTEKDDDEVDEVTDIQELQQLINDSTVDDVVEMVVNGDINVDEAIAYEMVGKNRNTLLNKLEELKTGE